MKLKLSQMSHRTKDSILKFMVLAATMTVLAFAFTLIMNDFTRATEVRSFRSRSENWAETESEVETRINKTEFKTETKKIGKRSETEAAKAMALAGGEAAETEVLAETESVETEDLAETEVVEAETQSETEVVETEMQSETEAVEIEDYSGAPSDVPEEALVRYETEESGSELESEPESEEETEISDYPYDEDKAVALAQLMWAEARGCSKREQSLVAWTVLNRVDAHYSGMTDFWSILTAPDQFAYSPNNPYEQYEYEIAVDVLQRWAAEKDGVEDSGRTLPEGYLYYYGDGVHNYFGMNGFSNELWFGLGDPYSDAET